jgi:hypothetical protein
LAVRVCALTLIVWSALSAFGGPAWAAAGDVFSVRDVAVDASSEAATSARDTAIRGGRNAAFNALLKRLTLKANWPRLPKAADANPEDYLLSFTITDERTSTTRYLAKITYDFDPDKIRALLKAYGIPFSETRAKPAIVLPVLLTQSGAMLWQPENAWAQAWRAKSFEQALAPLIVPVGDLSDISETAGLDPRAPDWFQVKSLASYYGAVRVLVAAVSVQQAAQSSLLDVRLTEVTPSGADEERLSFQGPDEAHAFNAAIDDIAQAIQERWKRQTVIAGGAEGTLLTAVRFDSLAEWVAIRDHLEQSPIIRAVTIVGLTINEALVNLRYVGTREQLGVNLAQSDLRLSVMPDGSYELTAAGGLATGAVAPAAETPRGRSDVPLPQPR